MKLEGIENSRPRGVLGYLWSAARSAVIGEPLFCDCLVEGEDSEERPWYPRSDKHVQYKMVEINRKGAHPYASPLRSQIFIVFPRWRCLSRSASTIHSWAMPLLCVDDGREVWHWVSYQIWCMVSFTSHYYPTSVNKHTSLLYVDWKTRSRYECI